MTNGKCFSFLHKKSVITIPQSLMTACPHISTTFPRAHLNLFFSSLLMLIPAYLAFRLHTNVFSWETSLGFDSIMTLTLKSDSGDSDSALTSPSPPFPLFARPCITISHFLCDFPYNQVGQCTFESAWWFPACEDGYCVTYPCCGDNLWLCCGFSCDVIFLRQKEPLEVFPQRWGTSWWCNGMFKCVTWQTENRVGH